MLNKLENSHAAQTTFAGSVFTKSKHAVTFQPGHLVLLKQTLKIFESAESFADGAHCISRLSILGLELIDDLGVTRRGYFRFEVHDASGDAHWLHRRRPGSLCSISEYK